MGPPLERRALRGSFRSADDMRVAAYVRPRLVPTLAALAGALLTALLGSWQLERAGEKARLQARVDQAGSEQPVRLGAAPLDAASVEYRIVETSGTFNA